MSRCSLLLLISVLLVLPAVTAPLLADGEAWTRREDGYYIKISSTWLGASQEYDYNGDRQNLFRDTVNFRDGGYGSTEIGFQGELGITDWLTGTLSTQYKVAVRQARYVPRGRDTSQSSSGLGDTWIGARVRLLPESYPLAGTATLAVKAPTGAARQDIPLGTGVVDYHIGLAAGMPFTIDSSIHGYGLVSGGYRIRNNASNELTYRIETGVTLVRGLQVQTLLDGVHSTADFEAAIIHPESVSINRSSVVGDQSYLRWSLGLQYAANEGMDVGATFTQQLSGRNSLVTHSFAIGVAWKK
jgi:hypothetical protein